jgi:hypothetical protein
MILYLKVTFISDNMKIGILAGGFKPFTSGHFAELSLAESENDLVLLFYALAERKKGSNYLYDIEMAKEFFNAISCSGGPLDREFGKKLKVVKTTGAPLSYVFNAILNFLGQTTPEYSNSFEKVLSEAESLTIYGDREDSMSRFVNYTKDPAKLKKYFGYFKPDPSGGGFFSLSDVNQSTGKKRIIRFDTGYNSSGDIDSRSIKALKKRMPNSSLELLQWCATRRGTDVRRSILSKNELEIRRSLLPSLNDEEFNHIVKILYRGIPKQIKNPIY